MIEIYLKTNTNYNKNGDITLDPTSCTYKNSENLLTLEHFIDDEGRWKYINFENVIAAEENGKKKLYRIYNVVRELYSVTAYARPIFYDLIDKVLLDVRPTNKTGEEALNILLEGTGYTGHSNITMLNTSYYIRKNIVEALIGDIDNSFLNRWGGEFYCENFDVYINDVIGSDNGVRIEFGYNLNEIEEDVNIEEVVTRIIPVGYDGIMLEGDTPWVDSPLINKYTQPKMRVIEFSDIKVKESSDAEEGFDTIEEARAELIRQCNLLFDNGIDKPTINYKIDMINLANTTAYKDFKMLVEVNKGDTVTCYIKHLDIDVKARVIDYERDLITGEYTYIELGNAVSNFFNNQADIQSKVDNILNDNGSVNAGTVEGAINATKTKFKALKDIAQPQDVRAIIFEDRVEDSPTFGCMCLGTMGFEIASSFKPGTKEWAFRTFGTGQGFFADLIVAGSMLADRIKSGMLMSMNEKTWINMDDGTFSFADGKLSWLDNVLNINGNLKQINSKTNKIACEIKDNSFIVYDHSKDDSDSHEVGRLRAYRTQNKSDSKVRNAIALNSRYDDLLIIGYLNEVGQLHEVMVFDSTGEYDGVSNVSINGAVKAYKLYFQNSENTFAGDIIGDGNMLRFRTSLNEGGLFVFGQAGSLTDNIMEVSRDRLYHKGSVKCGEDFSCKNLLATGTKNRLVRTKDYGNRALNAYETASCFFGDIGESQTDSNGEVIINIDDIFLQTVNTNEEYHVFISKYGKGDIWVEERNENMFKVKSTLPNIKFSYEIKAKQKNYERERLKEIQLSEEGY
ncbi:MAG: hypothetical protein NSGCLCUN01_03323 [uncultured Clostridium sp.]